MGLLDSVLGQVLGGAAQKSGGLGDAGGLAEALGGLLANNGQQGGLGGLVSKFEQAGMGDVIGSWIGKGDNAPVSGGQLNEVLGSDVVSSIADKLGINAAMLLPMLATMLPSLIDQLTPNGKVPDEGLNTNEDLLSSLSGLLQKR
ncbi:YidB family protein [Variovorax sp. LT1R16]|uniref:YidB family protein n=1 Tax=Variovorax sp. LT1R16 TaxID=3443728 RepID=UPI003F48892B